MDAWDFTSQLAQLNQYLKDWAVVLRKDPATASAISGIDFCIYGSDAVIELFVERTDQQPRTRTWWFDIRKEREGWSVNHMVSVVQDGVSDTIHDETLFLLSVDDLFSIVRDRLVLPAGPDL